jgi:transposase
LVRKLDAAIDFSFIYDVVKDLYSPDHGRPSIEPVMLFKMYLIRYVFRIRSMRETVEQIRINVAYRWFLDLAFMIPFLIIRHQVNLFMEQNGFQTFV